MFRSVECAKEDEDKRPTVISISLCQQEQREIRCGNRGGTKQAYPGVGVPSSRVEAVLVPLVRVF